MHFGVWGLGFKGLGFRDLYLWFEVYGFGGLDFRVRVLGFEVWVLRVFGLWFRVEGSRLWYKDLGFKCLGFGFWVFESLKVASKSTQRLC